MNASQARYECDVLRVVLAAAAYLVSSTAPQHHCVGAQKPPTDRNEIIQAIVAACKERDRRLASFEISWSEEFFIDPAVVAREMRGKIPDASKLGGVFPRKAAARIFTRRLLFDGSRLRYEARGPFVDYDLGDYMQTSVSTFNGSTGASLVTGDSPSVHPRGFLRKDIDAIRLQEWNLRPVFLWVRALHPTIGKLRDIQQYRLGASSTPGDSAGHVVLVRHPYPDRTERLTIDPARDYVVTRYEATEHSTDVVKLSYEKDSRLGWLLSGWECASYTAAGDLADSIRVHAVTRAFDVSPSDADFALTFPPNTLVQDTIRGEQYIQRAYGRKRIILPGEDGDYQDFVATETGQLLPGAGRRASWWYWLIAFLVIVAGALFLFWWQRTRSA